MFLHILVPLNPNPATAIDFCFGSHKLVDMVLAIFALFVFVSPVPATPTATDTSQLDQGYRDMYNLDFNGAHKAFGEFEQQQPADPFGPASQAAAYLFSEFERLKVLRSEFFAEDKGFLGAPKLKADPNVKAQFEKALNRSHQLSDQMFRDGKTPERAQFASIVCTALHADYLAMIEKENWQALNEIKDARTHAEALIAKHPEMKDSYLSVGVENYLLSQKGAPVRMFLRLTGAQTDKDTGIQKLKIVAAEGHYFKPYAKILLAIAAVRDKNRAAAGLLMADLSHEFPGNGLFKDEVRKLSSSCTADC